MGIFIGILLFPMADIFGYTVNPEIIEGNLPLPDHLSPRVPQEAQYKTAILTIESHDGDVFTPGDVVRAVITVDPQEQSINTVTAFIKYPQDKVRLLDISITDSAFSLFVTKDVDEVRGLVTIIGGQPFPGIDEKSSVATLIFEVLESGEVAIDFLPTSMVLANDGYGTDVLAMVKNIRYIVVPEYEEVHNLPSKQQEQKDNAFSIYLFNLFL